MFSVKDVVYYSNTGICEIADIGLRNLSGTERMYYMLKPVYNVKSTVFIPIDNKTLTDKLRYTITEDEAHEIIMSLSDGDIIWIDDERKRNEEFKRIVSSGDLSETLKMIKGIYFHHQNLKLIGKKLKAVDEKIMKAAENAVYAELAYVLKIDPENVPDYIAEELAVNE